MANIHQKTKNGTWYISYRQDGRLKHRSLRTKNARKARTLKKEIELLLESSATPEISVSAQPPRETKNVSIDEFWDDFMKWAREHRSERTIEEYANWFGQFREYSVIQRLGELSMAQVEGFKSRLRAQGKGKPTGVGLDDASINNALKTLRSIWNHAQKLGYYAGENPFARVEPYRIAQRPPRDYLGQNQISALMTAAEEYAHESNVRSVEARNVRLAIGLMALAGLRRREACYARWEWIRWRDKVLIISSHGEFAPKNKRNRIVSLHDDLISLLKPYRQKEGYILTSTRANNGKNRYRVDFRKGFSNVCAIAGLQATPHDLRHSFASRHAVAGTSLHVIAGWLGHSTTSVTERYAHFQMGYNEAANNI